MSTEAKIAEEIDFVQTGPGTIAGRYLRRVWQPVFLSRDLAKGQAVPIRIMSEEFTLYRGESGRPYVIEHRCPHRGTQLSTGIVRGELISCRYHGWTFDPTGQCTAQPAEPQPFCGKVKIATYPAREAIGLIFAYLGEGTPPPFPEWPKLGMFVHRHRMDCNYFQSAENIVDDVHVTFSHRNSGLLRHSRRAAVPLVRAHETAFGLTQELRHPWSTELNHFIMPNMCYLQFDHRKRAMISVLFFYVPIDDTHHNHYMSLAVTTSLPKFIDNLIFGAAAWIDARRRVDRDAWFTRKTLQVLSGKSTFDRITHARLQDTVICVGQGAIADRRSERLGRSDAAVILLRKIWRRELRLLADGKPLTEFTFPQFVDASGAVAGLELAESDDALSDLADAHSTASREF
ncbi:MAG TPA: Rieske 2Fe-2S domain-containing protein [Xanthobacteraceae bacterium]|nr:Rieske 2Fe-2S domain-containing protein [Xanthobacteraceae bacterium]